MYLECYNLLSLGRLISMKTFSDRSLVILRVLKCDDDDKTGDQLNIVS